MTEPNDPTDGGTMSAPTLPDYNADARCPKCGHDDVGTRFHRASGINCLFGQPCTWLGVDHMARHCRRCGYEWQETPKSDTLAARATPAGGTEAKHV